MAYEQLLGLPVDLAQKIIARDGVELKLCITQPPKGADETGTLRVVALREEADCLRLIAARFQDGQPEA